ncbi:EpsG family protein, partial [Bacteroidales bacterium OttesenSCG-928-M06]|nr:EpsG family protein [Bacteroidales bacterium OttesenSCG-928-M06]
IATSFSFISLLYLMKGKKVKYLMCIFIGSMIHVSVVIFLLLPFIKHFSFGKIKLVHLITFFFIPIIILNSSRIALFMASFIKNEYYQIYGMQELSGGASTYVILIELLSLLCLFFIKKSFIEKNDINYTLYSTLPLATLLAPLTLLDGSLIRIGQYFTIYLLLIVPFMIDNTFKRDKEKNLIYCIAIVLLICLSLNSSFEYYFFWEETPFNLNY